MSDVDMVESAKSARIGDPAPLIAGVLERARTAGILLDSGQQRALERAAGALAEAQAGTLSRGFYLYGPVGRGKTWMLDALIAGLPRGRVKRVHFHEFFRDLQRATAAYFPAAGAGRRALDDLLNGVDVLAFDEFHVHDPGDATLLLPLLRALAERPITLLLSSNYAPEGLLPNKIFHDIFAEGIEMLTAHLTVIELSAGPDYRTREVATSAPSAGFRAGTWGPIRTWPAAEPVEIGASGHSFSVNVAAEGILRFRFDQLLAARTSVTDLLEWAERFDTWIVQDVPPLATVSPRAQQRFVNLIDVLVDRDRILHIESAVPRTAFTAGVELPTDIQRTISRLSLLRELPRPAVTPGE